MYHQSIPEAKTDKILPEYSWHIESSDLLDVDNVMDLADFYGASKMIAGVRNYWISIDGEPVRAYTEQELRQLAAKIELPPAA